MQLAGMLAQNLLIINPCTGQRRVSPTFQHSTTYHSCIFDIFQKVRVFLYTRDVESYGPISTNSITLDSHH